MDIEKRVKKVLIKNALKDIDTKELNIDSPLIEYGVGLDSVATLELVVALEEEFQIRIDESEITPETFESIKSISSHISQRI
ncbi:MAG: acyl carrier protein [Thermodesulfobacteriota bacterium]